MSIELREPASGDALPPALPWRGRELVINANSPVTLSPAGAAWHVAEGRIEVFAVDPGADGVRVHVASFGRGEVLFGAAPGSLSLVAVAIGDARLVGLSLEELRSLVRQEQTAIELTAAVETWIERLTAASSPGTPPAHTAQAAAGAEVVIGAEGGVVVPADGVVWIRPLHGEIRWFGEEKLPWSTGDLLLPLARESWLASSGEARLSVVPTTVLLRSGRLWEELERFHRLFAAALVLRREHEGRSDRERLERRRELDEQALLSAQAGLASVLLTAGGAPFRPVATGGVLLAACQLVGRVQGIEIAAPAENAGGRSSNPVEAIATASRVRYRRVLLRGDWWRRDGGPLLAFRRRADGAPSTPVALLPTRPGRYDLLDPETGAREHVDAAVAEQLEAASFMFYTPLPEERVALGGLLGFALRGSRRDLRFLLGVGASGGLLALLVPLVTAEVFGQVIPDADRLQLVRLTLALVVAAVAGAMLHVARGFALLRLGARIDGAVQPAVWDRLLALPASFFRRFTVGDLAQRTMGVEAIRATLSGDVTTSLLSAVFSVFSLFILFYFSRRLALVALALVAILVLVTTLLSWLQVRHQRVLLAIEGRIASLLFGLFHGLGKLRVGGAEERAYALWAERFAEQRRWTFKAQSVANLQAVFSTVYGVGSTIAIFAMAARLTLDEENPLSLSAFLAFSAAFGQFQAAALLLVSVLSGLLLLAPVFERLQPILEADPEVDSGRVAAETLEGDVEMSHATFRYNEDGPAVLDDVSIRARAGEFIALVGPSGSGKSTCLRLLLGFEEPSLGSIYYDGQDLPSLDLRSVRRQIGVVLQDGRPMTGDIYSNIVGTANLGVEAAWEAAEMAGLAQDIREMPMGMHTIISEGAGTFSGGQRQRLLIARALVHRPRVLLFDEATSALDNRTQEIVSRSLESLQATRILVAHRLSTVRNADRIYVLERGRVVEQGGYEELVAQGGLFSRLAERQLA